MKKFSIVILVLLFSTTTKYVKADIIVPKDENDIKMLSTYDESEYDIEEETSLFNTYSEGGYLVNSVSSGKMEVKVDMSNVESMFKVRRMQEFHIQGSNLYITERCDYDGDGYQDDCAILKFTILNKVATYTKGNYTVIKNSGHGETLDMFTYKNITYFLVGCKDADEDKDSSLSHYSLQIGRVQFSPGAVYGYASIKRVSAQVLG